jgi:5-methylthioribose kinase
MPVELIDAERPVALRDILLRLRCVEEGEGIVRVGCAGEGNMNLTLRVVTDRRRLIVKQARPWVEKYPQIAAPAERANVEAWFYQRVAGLKGVAERMPRLLAHDADCCLLVLEDVGEQSELAGLYRGRAASSAELADLAGYLAALQGDSLEPGRDRLVNRQMRELNHAHQYIIPLQSDNGLKLDDIETGLHQAAQQVIADAAYVQKVQQTGEQYRSEGQTLLHGDFFPGSWLSTAAGVRVIDPEFAFHGPREYDPAVAMAHFFLAGQPTTARQWWEACAVLWPMNEAWFSRFAAAEVMRRLIGYAQLPLTLENGRRAALLRRAVQAMKQDRWQAMADD